MVDLSTSCVAHWKTNDNTANTIVVDDSGYSNDGAASENTDQMHVDGKINGGLYFDDSLHRYVQVPDDDSLSFLGEFSISFEVKRESANHIGAVLCKSTTSNQEYLVTFNSDNLTVMLYDGADASNYIGAYVIHESANWTHVMIVRFGLASRFISIMWNRPHLQLRLELSPGWVIRGQRYRLEGLLTMHWSFMELLITLYCLKIMFLPPTREHFYITTGMAQRA